MRKKILIVLGDPNSVNSEIIFKSLRQINNSLRNSIYLIANYDLLKKQFRKLKYSLNLSHIENINQKISSKNIKVLNLDLKFKNPFKVSKKQSSEFVKKSLNYAHKLAKKKEVCGIINCAIDKSLLDIKGKGVTEYLARKCNIPKESEVMLIYNNKLSVSPVTTHIDVSQISKNINKKLLIKKIQTIEYSFKKYFKKKPRIAILGLNPHNSEMKKNSIEKKVILPTVKKLQKLGIKVNGPLVADTIFINEFKNYDVIIGMYHDQVLAPFKALYKFDAINITLGLKYLRTSPDHGTAKNLIGKNKANPLSLINCINFINKFGI